ncbi:conserved membrane hypothetical protein [Syntrophobacter sp. SbD1]|nr:conserved membrane hypothetical protein [Syntrophobacter sp. SbD1]
MANAEGMATGKKAIDVIGIGPEGRLGGLIQFAGLGVLSVVVFVYALSPATIVLTLLPATLIMLITLGQLVLIGDGFPFAPPGGNWTPAVSRVEAGAKMTIIWAAFTAVFLIFMLYIYPGWPMSPLYLWWGAIAFWCTLLYGINWNTWPVKGKMHPWLTMLVGFTVVLVVTSLVWNFLTNLAGTPLANTPMDHKGPLNVSWLTGYIVWAIAWFFILSPVFTTQGWPFTSLGHPGTAIAQTVVAHAIAYICWSGSLALGMSPSFSFGAVASSLIFWALVYGWHLQFWGVTKYTGAARALAAFVVQCVLTAFWIGLLKVVLAPVGDAIAAAKLPADVNILIIYLNLCIFAPALICHNAMWLRWPLTLPNPPGTPPPDVSAP